MERTAEQDRMQALLVSLGVEIIVNSAVSGLVAGGVRVDCIYGGPERQVACNSFIPVTSREPDDVLWRELEDAGLSSLVRIGDCKAPGIIAQAVFDGHRAARSHGEPEAPARRERVVL
jgi:dimethylamine/trimethylamine dehydrogenase